VSDQGKDQAIEKGRKILSLVRIKYPEENPAENNMTPQRIGVGSSHLKGTTLCHYLHFLKIPEMKGLSKPQLLVEACTI